MWMLIAMLVGCGTETPEAFTDSYAAALCDAHVRCGIIEEDAHAACLDGTASPYDSCAGGWDADGAAQCVDDFGTLDCEYLSTFLPESCAGLCAE